MASYPLLLLILDLLGTFAFALNGGLTAVRAVRVDVIGVITLGVLTAVGGGILRDLMLGALPPETFSDWRYLTVAAGGGLIAFLFSRRLTRLGPAITVFDAAGLALFAVTGAGKAFSYGAGALQSILLGALTAVGGGTIRDVIIRRVPSVLSSGLYAIPALVGATIVVVLSELDVYRLLGVPVALLAAVVVFAIRMIGLHFGLDAPGPPGSAGPIQPDRRDDD